MNGSDFRKQLDLLFTDISEAIEESEAAFCVSVSPWQMEIARGEARVLIKAHRDLQLIILEHQQTRRFECFDGEWLSVDSEQSLMPVLGDVLRDLNGAELAVYL